MAKKKKEKAKAAHSPESLREKALVLGQEIFALRNELALNRKLEKPHLLKAKKRERARALTMLTQQMRGQVGQRGE